jgi:predicted CXXCH cytochrome family protein
VRSTESAQRAGGAPPPTTPLMEECPMRDRRLLMLSAATVALAGAAALRAGLQGSGHDFSTAAWNTSGEMCRPCHTPHHAQSAVVPLWDHNTSVASFTLYASDTLDANVTQPTGVSKACLSCHDGTVALNAFGGETGADFISGTAHLGTDLANDHPIAFTYDSLLAVRDGGLHDPQTTTVPALEGKTIRESMLIDGELHCTSCHDAHNARGDAPATPYMLLVNNAGSALCLTCHDK